MAFIEWSEQISIGLKTIDDQHKILINFINQLHDAMKTRKGDIVTEPILQGLVSYTKEHFTFEEQLFEKSKYTHSIPHNVLHRSFIKKVEDMHKDFKSGKTMINIEIMDFLQKWLTDHIQKEDKKYVPFFKAIGIQ